jgi:hypothetical protein
MRNLYTYYLSYPLPFVNENSMGFFTRGKNFQEVCLGNEDPSAMWDPSAGAKFPRAVPTRD